LILYRLYNPEGPRWKVALKRRIIAIASAWCELILTVAKDQATAFGLMLNRKPGTTQSFRYGVDVDFFNQLFEKKQATFKPRTIFCPGSAYRDEDVLLQSISDLEIKVTQYMLVDFHRGQSRNNSPSIKQVGKAVVSTVFNVPYQDYIKACLEANVVVISVYNKDKPAGLTALLECMALGRPVVITQGLSSRDYVVNGVTALEYCPGDAEDLKNKIRLLLETPGLAEALGQNAREAILKEYNLQKCGAELAELLWRVHETMQKED
jgi:glycosyltransferase involved in cell wall biosynthesis